MSVRPEILALIVACSLVTLVPRVLPFLAVNKIKLPDLVLAWLSYIPATVIAALLCKEVLLANGFLRAWDSPHLIAGLAALVAAFVSRGIVVTLVVGMAVFVAAQKFLA